MIPDRLLEPDDPHPPPLSELLALLVDPVVRVQLLLQLDNRLVPLVQPRRQSNHNVSLLQQQLLVTIHLGFVLLDLLTLTLQLTQTTLVLLTNCTLLLFQGSLELGGIFNLLATL